MIEIDNTPWFIAADVTMALGLSQTAQVKATSNMSSNHVQDFRIPGTKGRLNKIVTEAGLYDLVMQSRKPEAQAFKSWVTGTVLPAIRKIVTPESPSAQQEAAGVALCPTSTTPLQIPSGSLYGTTQRP
ncbi:MAG: hypothetical protein IKE14_11820 [Loktanella sp.]|nr:hypothetical protein [Loktanella sp.]